MIKNYIHFLGGAQYSTSPFLIGESELSLMSNVNVTYKLGAILKSLGYKQVGGALDAKPITGLHNFRQSSSIQKMLATCNNAAGTNLTLQYNNAGTWTDIVLTGAWDGFEDTKVEMEDFIGYCFMVGYDSTDDVWLPFSSLTGTTFSTSTNVDADLKAKYIKRYRDRLYVANLYDGGALPYRVGISDLPSGDTLAWTEYQADTGWIDVDYSEAITGLGSNWDRLFIFTDYSAYMYDQVSKKKVWDIGCCNHRTIKNLGAHMIWANRDGVWDSTSGRPINIAGRIIDFIKAGTPDFAEVIDQEYWLHVGTVTVNGVVYSNATVIYNLQTQTWRVREFVQDTPTIFARYNLSGDDRLYIGVNDGEVHEMTKYYDSTPVYTDDGADITAMFETKAFDFDQPEIQKKIQKLVFYADRAQGLNLKAMIVNKGNRNLNKIVDIGVLKDYITSKTVGLEGHFIKIVGTETGKLPYWSFFGFSAKYEPSTKI